MEGGPDGCRSEHNLRLTGISRERVGFKKEKSEIRRNKYKSDWGVEIRSLNTNCGRSIGFKTVFCFQVF